MSPLQQTKDILILKSLPVRLEGLGSLQECSSIGVSGGQGKDHMYLPRELAVHPALGMDTDHPLRWVVDVVAEVLCVLLSQQEKVCCWHHGRSH